MILALALTGLGSMQANAAVNTSVNTQADTQQKYVIVQGANVRLRFEPNLSSSWLRYDNGKPRYAAKGTRLEYLGESGNFYKVKYAGYQLYISKDYASITTVGEKKPAAQKKDEFFVVVNGTNVRLRTGPGTNYSYFTWNDGSPCYLPKGSYLKYLGDVGDFYKCDYQGHTVFISKKYSYVTK